MKSTIEIEWILNDLPWREFCEKHFLDPHNQIPMIFVDSKGFKYIVGDCGSLSRGEQWYGCMPGTKVIKYALLNLENKLKAFI